MLSPEQRADAVNWLRSEQLEYPSTCHRGRCIATAIAALTNEAALAEQVRKLREALLVICQRMSQCPPKPDSLAHARFLDEGLGQGRAALALELPDAARQAAENAERAGLLEWWFNESNEEARNRIRDKRNEAGDQWPEYQWTAEEWIAEVRAAKEAGNV